MEKWQNNPLLNDANLPSYDWIMGFIEGEGSFTIDLQIRNGKPYALGCFRINLKKYDVDTLRKIQAKLKIGKVYFKSLEHNRKKGIAGDDQYEFKVRKKDEIQKLLNFCLKTKKHSIKKKDIELFYTLFEMLKQKKHLTKEGFLKMAGIRDRMFGGEFGAKRNPGYKTREDFEKIFQDLEEGNIVLEKCPVCGENKGILAKNMCKSCYQKNYRRLKRKNTGTRGGTSEK